LRKTRCCRDAEKLLNHTRKLLYSYVIVHEYLASKNLIRISQESHKKKKRILEKPRCLNSRTEKSRQGECKRKDGLSRTWISTQ
jgi:hypothetical protein